VSDNKDLVRLRLELERISATLQDRALDFPTDLRDDVVRTIEIGILPRLGREPGPLNVVFAGPTGSGKSTLVNSIAGRVVSHSGVLRPTTTTTLVYTGSEEASGFEDAGVSFDYVIGASPILDAASLIDTPDLDSTNLENRKLALEALSMADVVVFVTSALRYGDRVPWEVFRQVSELGTPIVFALNRVSSASSGVVTDFRRRARSAGMALRVLRVGEHHLGPNEILPAASVRELRRAVLSMVAQSGGGDSLAARIGYVSRRLAAMHERISSETGYAEDLAHEASWTEFAPSQGFETRVTGWLGEPGIAGVSRWSGGRAWRFRYRQVVSELREELVTTLERDLRLLSQVDRRALVDLSDTAPDSHLGELDDLVDEWLESVMGKTSLDDMPYRTATQRVGITVEAVRIVASGRDEESSETGIRAALRLRSAIGGLFGQVMGDLIERTSFRKELAALEEMISSIDALALGKIASNA
jgi:energy-coupling factor transporter ATP-binding protein EcfA2